MLLPILGVVATYLIGSIPFGYVMARAKGVDIFTAGSGNIGATNVSRVLGRKYGLLVFALDVLKGALPTAVMRALNAEPAWAVAAGLAAMLGHLFPIYLRFRGGKGVATGFGVVAVLLPVPAAMAFFWWLTIFLISRYVSLASIVAVLVLVAMQLGSSPHPFDGWNWALSSFCLLTAGLVIIKHRTNIMRLIRHKENRVSPSRLEAVARLLHLLALGTWVGGGIMFSFIVAPTLFETFASRSAGIAVGAIFPAYFALQGVCGVLALATSLAWADRGRIHRIRLLIILFAVVGVIVGWPLVGIVANLRIARQEPLVSSRLIEHRHDPNRENPAREEFARWHAISLSLNLIALGLATVGLALAANLPPPRLTDEHDSL